MSRLAVISLLLGIVAAAAGAACAGLPGRTRLWMLAFPRSRAPAFCLLAADTAWAAWLMWQMPLGRFDSLKPLLFVLAPALLVLVFFFMDDLLAARALGGLLMLIPAPLLDAARWHPSSLRLVIVATAYALAVVGMMLMLSPHRLRRLLAPWVRDEGRCRQGGVLILLLGLVLTGLGIVVY